MRVETPQGPDGRLDIQRRTSHTCSAVLPSRHKGGADGDDLPPPITDEMEVDGGNEEMKVEGGPGSPALSRLSFPFAFFSCLPLFL